jgi:hypothetical protein
MSFGVEGFEAYSGVSMCYGKYFEPSLNEKGFKSLTMRSYDVLWAFDF